MMVIHVSFFFSELIQTERSHCRTLMIMQRVFARGMMEELHMSKDMVERIFPSLDEMIDIHLTFLHRLTERQKIKVHNYQSNSFLQHDEHSILKGDQLTTANHTLLL